MGQAQARGEGASGVGRRAVPLQQCCAPECRRTAWTSEHEETGACHHHHISSDPRAQVGMTHRALRMDAGSPARRRGPPGRFDGRDRGPQLSLPCRTGPAEPEARRAPPTSLSVIFASFQLAAEHNLSLPFVQILLGSLPRGLRPSPSAVCTWGDQYPPPPPPPPPSVTGGTSGLFP